MNKIWLFIIVVCIGYGLYAGRAEELVNASLNTPKDTLDLLIKVGGLIIFYNGMFQIAVDSGLIKKLSKVMYPITRLIFKDIQKNSVVHEYVSANIIANLLGLGIASTPIAIKALNAMKEETKDSQTATKSMVMLVIMNISAFTIFPLTILGVRKIYEAKINIELVPFFIITSFILTIVGIIMVKIFGRSYD